MQFRLFDLGQYPYNVHIYFFMDIWVGTCHISGRLRHRIMLLSIHVCPPVKTGMYNNSSFSDLYCSNRADGVVGQVPGSSVGKHEKAQIPFADGQNFTVGTSDLNYCQLRCRVRGMTV